MTQLRWVLPPQNYPAREGLTREGLSPLLAAVLASRGMDCRREVERLLSPQRESLSDPLLLQDMDRAVERIRQGVEREESIAVYGDYDVDGITSTTLITDFLRGLGAKVTPYIPHRMEEGYGLNPQSVTALAEQGITLLITVDCGITAVHEVEVAAALGMDVIITDHHGCKDTLPAAVAVVNPHRPTCPSPFKELAGVGVALKLAMALAGQDNWERVLDRYATLAAVGTIADVMPMVEENRVLVRRGLGEGVAIPQLGLRMLIEESGLRDKPLNTVGVGYTLAPRLNASGRMGRAEQAVELLLTDDPRRGRALAARMCELNRERQAVEAEILAQCVAQLESSPQEGVILLSSHHWHQGVVGIVASRLAERYGCPTVIVCLSEGHGKGSCRSYGGVNLFKLLQSCEHLLEGFGGHALAAGLTVSEENILPLAHCLRQNVASFVESQEAVGLRLDCDIDPHWLTVDGVESLDRLEPWGSGNPRPALLLRRARVVTASAVGHGRHLKLRLERDGVVLDAIWFSAGVERPYNGELVDVAFHPQINEFRGARTPQLQVLDLRCAEEEGLAFDKFSQGETLSPYEIELLTPQRENFVRLWRHLKGRSANTPIIHDSPQGLAGRLEGGTLSQTQVCLDVLAERGLITVSRHLGELTIALNRVEKKVDLEDSAVLQRLRGTI